MKIELDIKDLVKLINTAVSIHNLSKTLSIEELSIYDDIFNIYDLLYEFYCINCKDDTIETFENILFSDKTVYDKYMLLFNISAI